jgi:hypothetical protein
VTNSPATMETDWTQTLGAGPLLGIAAGAVALLLILIIWLRDPRVPDTVTVSVLTAFATGIPAQYVIPTLANGFGSSLMVQRWFLAAEESWPAYRTARAKPEYRCSQYDW